MERIDCGQEFAVFVDAADTACGLRSRCGPPGSFRSGRVICVMGESLPTDATEAAVVRSVVSKMADVTIVTDALTSIDAAWQP